MSKINRIEFLNKFCEISKLNIQYHTDQLSGKNIYILEIDKEYIGQIEFINASKKYFYTIYINVMIDFTDDKFEQLKSYIQSLQIFKHIILDLSAKDFYKHSLIYF